MRAVCDEVRTRGEYFAAISLDCSVGWRVSQVEDTIINFSSVPDRGRPWRPSDAELGRFVTAVNPVRWPENSTRRTYHSAAARSPARPPALHKHTVVDRGSSNKENSGKETARWPQEL